MKSELRLSVAIGKALRKKKKTMALAESCSGGYISHLITSVPGSSAYFMGAAVSYDNNIKQGILGVKPKTIKDYGAVSAECAAEMALGIRKKFKVDYAIATTGIAGPTGAVKGKSVGTVYIAFASKADLYVIRFQFKGSRISIIEQTARKSLEILLANIS